jgi:uncharacterized protein (DUF433 family)
MVEPYIEERDRGSWIKGTRVSLDSVVYRWLEGLSPESITESFPVLTLEQVYGAIAYYLSHRKDIDEYLNASEQDYDAFRERLRSRYPGLSRRLDDVLQPTETTRQ